MHIILSLAWLNSRSHHSEIGFAELTFSDSLCPHAGERSSLYFVLLASLYSAGSWGPPSEPTRTHMSVQPPPPSLGEIKASPADCTSLSAGSWWGRSSCLHPLLHSSARLMRGKQAVWRYTLHIHMREVKKSSSEDEKPLVREQVGFRDICK